MKGLEETISVSVVDPRLTPQGWQFSEFKGVGGTDPLIDAQYAHQLYTYAQSDFSGRATVPILWDKKRQTIVNNESADIMRILNCGFGDLAKNPIDLSPENLLHEIERLNARLYERVNNGVYRAGFASSQAAYEEAVRALFDEMGSLDELLSDGRKYLLGDQLTETDIRLFVTMIRFDVAYFGLFKCNLAPLTEFPHLLAHTRRLHSIREIGNTVHFDHIKHGYYSVKALNPNGIVPLGPRLSFQA